MIARKIVRKNRLVVVGNGFDLTAGAKTSYSDFFNSDYYKEKRESVASWVDKAKRYKLGHHLSYTDSSTFGCWDLLFYMVSRAKGKALWCDIEQVIHDTLVGIPSNSFAWDCVYNIMHGFYQGSGESETVPNNIFMKYPYEIRLMCLMFCTQYEEWPENVFQDVDVFYNKLLEQLQGFERVFGLYIHEQTSSYSFQSDVTEWIDRLLSYDVSRGKIDEEVLHIDSFNYSQYDHFTAYIRHLNGDYLHPIFGIDLTEEERKDKPEAQRFTKTSRRIYQEVFEERRADKIPPNNVNQAIIFGHSLNQMDYDYFVYLFNLLRFNSFDEKQMGEVQFVYRVYDPDREKDIKNNVAQAVYALLNFYEEYWRGKNQNTLINLLYLNNKLQIKRI